METNTEIYKIYFDKEINSVVMEWDGYATSKQFKQGTELMLNTLIQNNCSKVLADIKDMKIIAMEDQQWLNDEFLPRATTFGLMDRENNEKLIESIDQSVTNWLESPIVLIGIFAASVLAIYTYLKKK